jgi:ankyrin repeat protein
VIRPHDIRPEVWEPLSAAATGDAERLRALLARDPDLAREGYWYTPPLHFAVREGHLAAVRVLLDGGADPAAVGVHGDDLVTTARDRGYEDIARELEAAVERGKLIAPSGHGAPDHPIHTAAAADDVESVRRLLDAAPHLVHLGDRKGGTPLHRAVAASARRAIELLLDRGADIHALHGRGPGDAAGYAPADFQPIDVALWDAGVRVPKVLTACRGYLMSDPEMLRLLLSSGTDPNLPNWQHATPLHDLCGRDGRGRANANRAVCAAILLEAGADISAKDDEYRSTPLAWAARSDLPDMVEFLLSRGAPTNLPDDEPWATPLAWATRRGHVRIVDILRHAGAVPPGQ